MQGESRLIRRCGARAQAPSKQLECRIPYRRHYFHPSAGAFTSDLRSLPHRGIEGCGQRSGDKKNAASKEKGSRWRSEFLEGGGERQRRCCRARLCSCQLANVCSMK